MTGNLSRTVLRGAGARESARLPDLTNYISYIIKKEKSHWRISVAFLQCMPSTQHVVRISK